MPLSSQSFIRELFRPLLTWEALATIRKQAGSPDAPVLDGAVNTHIHLPPNFCAFENVTDAVRLAVDQKLRVVGMSNYYDFSVYSEFTRGIAPARIFPIFGIEIITLVKELVEAGIKINDPGNPGKMYVCGKGITRFEFLPPEAADLMNRIRTTDSQRSDAVVARLADVFERNGVRTGLTPGAIKGRIVAKHGCPPASVYLQERHIAMAFQEVLFAQVPEGQRPEVLARLFGTPSKAAPDAAVKIQDEIRSHLMKAGKPAYVEETFLPFEVARRLVLALGGIPCYPVLADGANPVCGYEASVESLIASLRSLGLHAAEFIPLRNSPETLATYVRSIRKAGIVVTAGTEHNTLDRVPLAPTCRGGAPIPDDVQAIFREGACVLAAHQFRSWHDLDGYVDSEGNLNSSYEDAESRIEAFSRLGAALISCWSKQP